MLTVPATEIAREHLGRPLSNAVLLGGFAAIERGGLARIGRQAIRDKFSGAVADKNVRAAEAAYEYVGREMEELTHA